MNEPRSLSELMDEVLESAKEYDRETRRLRAERLAQPRKPGVLDGVYMRMSKDEQWEYSLLQMCGCRITNRDGSVTVLMGSTAINKIRDFEKLMLEKYEI